MKKCIAIALLCTLGALQAGPQMQGDTALANLGKTINERKAELPKLKEQLKAAAKGSEEARRLRTKINQYEEFVTTGQAEIKARSAGAPSAAKAQKFVKPTVPGIEKIPAATAKPGSALRKRVQLDKAALRPVNVKPVSEPAAAGKPLTFVEELKQRVEGDFKLRPAAEQVPLKAKP